MSSKFFHSKHVDRRVMVLQKNANAYADGKAEDVLRSIRRVFWALIFDKERAKKLIGQHLALAYAMGFLDKNENKTVVVEQKTPPQGRT